MTRTALGVIVLLVGAGPASRSRTATSSDQRLAAACAAPRGTLWFARGTPDRRGHSSLG